MHLGLYIFLNVSSKTRLVCKAVFLRYQYDYEYGMFDFRAPDDDLNLKLCASGEHWKLCPRGAQNPSKPTTAVFNNEIARIQAAEQRAWLVHQGAFHALRPEDLQRRPDFFVGVAASFFQ